MNRKTVRLLALIASVAFAACGDTTDLVLGELSEAEANDLAGAVMFAAFDGTGDVPQPAPGGPAAVPFEYTSEFAGSVECPLGGLVAVTANLTVSGNTESEAGSINYAMGQVHQDCGVQGENHEFVLNGNPGLELAFLVENNGQGVVEWGGSVEGTIDWVTGDRRGSCTVALQFSGRQEGVAAVSGELAGSVCGFQVGRAFSIG